MKRERHFACEADLCTAFIAWAKARGFTPYAETDGWDVLLVDAEGRQIGVQAKMDLNLKVIAQALEESHYCESRGPDHRAVLVPFSREGVEPILARCGIHLYLPRSTQYTADEYQHGLRWKFDSYHGELPEFDWNPSQRCTLPEYVPDVAAGVPSPRTLSPWKVGALRVLAVLELQGHVTRNDIRDCGNDPRRWCAGDGYLRPGGEGRWLRADHTPTFDTHHPTVYAQIRRDEAKRLGIALGRVNRLSQSSRAEPSAGDRSYD